MEQKLPKKVFINFELKNQTPPIMGLFNLIKITGTEITFKEHESDGYLIVEIYTPYPDEVMFQLGKIFVDNPIQIDEE